MPLTRKEKETIVSSLVDKLNKSKSAVFADFTGLKVQDNEKLRKEAKKQKAEYLVAKKTLLKIALKQAGIEEVPTDKFSQSVATMFGFEDPTTAPKVASNFAKDNKALKMLSGLLFEKAKGEKYITLEQVKALAAMPGKQELLAMLVRAIKSPVSGFVNVLGGNLRGLVNTLNAIKDKKPA
mgnify:CR=1 FL=1